MKIKEQTVNKLDNIYWHKINTPPEMINAAYELWTFFLKKYIKDSFSSLLLEKLNEVRNTKNNHI